MNEPIFVGKHPTTHSVQQHTHENWELIYCTSGMGEVQFENGSKLPYTAGEIVAIPPRLPHCNQSVSGFTNIHMRVADATLPYRAAVKLADDAEKHLLTFFSEAYFYYSSDINRKEVILSGLGEVIVSYIVTFLSQQTYSEVVELVRTDILRNFTDENYRLERTLRSIPLNYDYIRKTFKKEIGATPHEYLTAMRMKKAERLLCAMRGEYTIAEVAEMCGFNEPLYFTRVFKKNFGVSPTAFNAQQASETHACPPRAEGASESPDEPEPHPNRIVQYP
ncbi:MAG TPA: AraC family transcriptional regulator [Clostridia bacterium]|nr:AraC family transcriptional regulator [Clostridia bacterium]